jgi:hypothetical protein
LQPSVDVHGGLVLPRAAQQHFAAMPGRQRACFRAKPRGLIGEPFGECGGLLETSALLHGMSIVRAGGSATPALSLPIDAE